MHAASVSTEARSVTDILAEERLALLDLGLRNPLLNYRPPKSKGAVVSGESSAAVFDLLVNQGRALGFRPAAEEADTAADAQENTAPDADTAAAAPCPPAEAAPPLARRRWLCTPHPEQDLDKRLLKTYRDANTYLAELGVNILYLALGMLHWSDSTSSQSAAAPLLLIPVELERLNNRYSFQIRYTQEDLLENFVLAKKLESLHLSLPLFSEDEDLDPAAYFAAVEACIGNLNGWRVAPDEIYLGFFSFGKFMMYRDLDLSLWPEPLKPDQHPVIQALLGSGFEKCQPLLPETASLDEHPDSLQIKTVLDADSSQLQAILEVRHGRHLVIQGPPGTGKSQTITNLIADAIGQNRSVLFVSEKMAALEVVKRRLDSLGLGDACLELHSHKSNKRELLKELERTLQLGQPQLQRQSESPEAYAQMRQQLNAYAKAVNTPVANTLISPYRAYGELLKINTALAHLQRPPHIVRPLLSPEDARQQERLIADYEAVCARVQQAGGPARHPFAHSGLQQLLPGERDSLQQQLALLQEQLAGLQQQAQTLQAIMPLTPPANFRQLRQWLAAAQRLAQLPDLSALDLACLFDAAQQDPGQKLSGQKLYEELQHFQKAFAALPIQIQPSFWAQDFSLLLQQLAPFESLPTGKLVQALQPQLQLAESLCTELQPAIQRLTDVLKQALVDRPTQWFKLASLAEFLLTAPDLQGLNLRPGTWQPLMPALHKVIQQAPQQQQAYLESIKTFGDLTALNVQHLIDPPRFKQLLSVAQTPEALQNELQALRVAQQALSALHKTRQDFSSAQRVAQQALEPGQTAETLRQTLQGLKQLASQPDLSGLPVADPSWRSRSRDLAHLLSLSQAQEDLRTQWQSTLVPEAWEADVLSIRQTLAQYAQTGFWRFFSGAYRRAWNAFKRLNRDTPPAQADAQLALLDTILTYQHNAAQLAELEPIAEQLFAEHWQSTHKDWALLTQIQTCLADLQQQVADQTLPPALLELTGHWSPGLIGQWQQRLERALDEWHNSALASALAPHDKAQRQLSWSELEQQLQDSLQAGEAVLNTIDVLSAHWQGPTEKPLLLKDWSDWLETLHTSQAYLSLLEYLDPRAVALLGPYWQGIDTDWAAAERLLTWVAQLHHKMQQFKLPDHWSDLLSPDWLQKLKTLLEAAQLPQRRLTKVLAGLPDWAFTQNIASDALSYQPQHYQRLQQALLQRQAQCTAYLQAWQTMEQTQPDLLHQTPGQLRQTLQVLQDLQQRLQAFEKTYPLNALFKGHWQGLQTNWSLLLESLQAFNTLQRELAEGQWPVVLQHTLLRYPAGWPDRPGLEQLQSQLHASATRLQTVLQALDWQIPAADMAALELSDLQAQCTDWLTHSEQLRDWVQYRQLQQTLHEAQLDDYVALSQTWPDADRGLLLAWRSHHFLAVLDAAFAERPLLSDFDRKRQQHLLERFRTADLAMQALNRFLLVQQHWQRLTGLVNALGQMDVLRSEFARRRRHKPIRRLFQEAGQAICQIKPVVMMSPLSIASYLAPGSVSFDLVIFDEASQVRPMEALGAILRGQQVVVVGDRKQLPPTRFFDSLSQDDSQDDKDNTPLDDLESVLDLFVSKSVLETMLRWHYRSRHESLIAVSNRYFYDNRLVVFPSPDAERSRLGLSLRHLPEAVYTGNGQNPVEARVIAEAVMAHARQYPDQSLGVVAFSVAQRDLLHNEIERLRRTDPGCEAFFYEHPHEPFFVKNLETVQGDERDVILISMGYGRNSSGQLRMQFGPLNQEGGERRLNVLISRARQKCVVFSNLQSQDIDLQKSNAEGVRVLKAFLAYAETGEMDLAESRAASFDSPFEEAVHDALVTRGHRVATQVGTAGFRIDLAVIDPEAPGRYLLGIECDGARYHSARSARDRDRLRQQVLEGLGWQIHRIWSTDWFQHPQQELERLELAIANARTSQPRLKPAAVPAATASAESPTQQFFERQASVAVDAADPLALLQAHVPAYVQAEESFETAGLKLQEIDLDTLTQWLIRIVQIEAPVHRDEALVRLARNAGVARLSQNMRRHLDGAWVRACRLNLLREEGGFLWLPEQTALPFPGFRDRQGLSANLRKAERIAPAEIQAAIQYVLEQSLGIADEELIAHVAFLLGISKSAEDNRQIIAANRQRLLQA